MQIPKTVIRTFPKRKKKKKEMKKRVCPINHFPAVRLIEMIEAVCIVGKTQSSPVQSHEELLEKYEYWPLIYA